MSLKFSMTVKLLTEQHLEFLSLKGDCIGLSLATLVKMPHYWKSHVEALICFTCVTQLTSAIALYIEKLTENDIVSLYHAVYCNFS